MTALPSITAPGATAPLAPGARREPRLNVPATMDGRDLLASLEASSIAACFLDPQYRGVLDKLRYGNEGVLRGQRRAALPQMGEDVIREFIRGIDRVLRPSGHLFLWIDKYHLCTGVSGWMADTALAIVDMVTWHKERIGMGYRTRRTSEHLIVLQKRPVRAKGVWTRHDIPDVWTERPARRAHAHAKPVALQAALIEAVTAPGDLVLDPAAGSFSVLAAAASAGRDFVGCDVVAAPEAP